MRFELFDHIPQEAEQAFMKAALHLPRMANFLPNVSHVEALEVRLMPNDVIERVDQWSAFAKHRLGIAITDATWVVSSRWDLREKQASWTVAVKKPRDSATSTGMLTMVPQAEESTLVTIAGDVSIVAGALPFPVRALARALSPMAERVIVGALEENLRALLNPLGASAAVALPEAS
jgi:hypothetical protein